MISTDLWEGHRTVFNKYHQNVKQYLMGEYYKPIFDKLIVETAKRITISLHIGNTSNYFCL